MREFLIKQTSPPFVVLWSLFIYWAVVLATHSAWSCGECVTKSMGVSAIVGTGLNASAFAGSQYDTLLGFVKGSPFTVMRFFLIPFCVALYSSIASVKKEDFTYLFPHDGPKPLTWGGVTALIVLAYVIAATVVNQLLRRGALADESPQAPAAPDTEKDISSMEDGGFYIKLAAPVASSTSRGDKINTPACAEDRTPDAVSR